MVESSSRSVSYTHLDVLAKKSGLNFSAALVRGIKEELGIRERKDI